MDLSKQRKNVTVTKTNVKLPSQRGTNHLLRCPSTRQTSRRPSTRHLRLSYCHLSPGPPLFYANFLTTGVKPLISDIRKELPVFDWIGLLYY